MKQIFLIIMIGVALTGCATPKAMKLVDPMELNEKVGTEKTPYRSVAPVILCEDCRY